jgi:hypothetical protein
MAVRDERVDQLDAPKTQRLPWAAVVEARCLHVADHAASVDRDGVDGPLRDATRRLVQLRDPADLGRRRVTAGASVIGGRHEAVPQGVYASDEIGSRIDFGGESAGSLVG